MYIAEFQRKYEEMDVWTNQKMNSTACLKFMKMVERDMHMVFGAINPD